MDLQALKSRMQEERAALYERLRVRPSGREAARALTRWMDGVLLQVFGEAGAPPKGAALVALGGYGREQMAPFSDVDALVLYAGPADEPAASALATRFFQTLWDLGLTLGNSLRSLEDAARTLTRDVASATALLEGRFLAGDADLFASFDASRKDFLARLGEEFLRAKCEEADARHQKHGGGSPFVTEPNIKASAGALRDLELLHLFDRAGEPRLGIPLLDAEGRMDLEDAEERLLQTRLLMHLAERRKHDRLGFDLGPRVALAFGFRDSREMSAVEAFMSDYYRSAKAVDRALRLARHALQERVASRAEHAAERRPRRLDATFVARGDDLELASPTALSEPRSALEAFGLAFTLFLQAQREKLAPTEPALEAVRRLLPRMTDEVRESPAMAELFRKLLSGRRGVAAALRAMHRAGLLGEYLPEFGTLDGLWQQDPYHEFTVDEHSLRCVENLERFALSPEREDQIRAEILGDAKRLDMLRLGVLLHDMGKGKGGAHVAVGTSMVPEVVRRMGLSEEEGRLVRFLVEHHLEMSRAIEQRDFSSPETLGRFCAVVGDEERVDLLYLLTAADMRGVGSHGFPRWKDALLTSLRELARERLRSGERPPVTAEERRKDILAHLPPGLSAADLDRHLELAPKRYALEVEPFDVVMHLRLIRDLEGGRNPTTGHVIDGPLRHFWICTRDRPGLFAIVAGAISARGAN
ncbi:MAG TPA: HD domain-containing protein, partial [Planctomycetota bacterium]|nr:HD domain-containing protein [Planctomycetota bacterium]